MSPDAPWPREVFVGLDLDVRIRYGRTERTQVEVRDAGGLPMAA
jgi:hypothetical protein